MKEFKVKEIMTRLVVTMSPTDTIHQAAAKLAANGISGAPVLENGEVVGVVSESDILHAVAPSFPKRNRTFLELLVSPHNLRPAHPPWGPLVGNVMSSLVVFKVSPEASIWEAASLIERKGVKRLPVVDSSGELVGIVSRADILRAMGRPDRAINADVVDTLFDILGPEAFEALEVTVDQGIATLTGQAERKSTKKIAARLARKVPGVIQVVDKLTYSLDDSTIKVETTSWDVEELGQFSSGPRS